MSKLDHKGALELAHERKKYSHLARCYVDLHKQFTKAQERISPKIGGMQSKIRELSDKLKKAEARVEELYTQYLGCAQAHASTAKDHSKTMASLLDAREQIAELERQLSAEREARERAQRALTRAGFTYLNGAAEWRPPLNKEAGAALQKAWAERDEARRRLASVQSLIDKWNMQVGGDPDFVQLSKADRLQLEQYAYDVQEAISSPAEAQPIDAQVDCCNPDCFWSGPVADCVTPKHETQPLCPECHDVTEPQKPAVEQKEEETTGRKLRQAHWQLNSICTRLEYWFEMASSSENRDKRDLIFEFVKDITPFAAIMKCSPKTPVEVEQEKRQVKYIARREWMEEWAGWVAKDKDGDKDGRVFFYEMRPSTSVSVWEPEPGQSLFAPSDRWKCKFPGDWRDSLHCIATHDEHGLTIIPRPKDAQEWARFTGPNLSGLQAFKEYYEDFMSNLGWFRLEDFNPDNQE